MNLNINPINLSNLTKVDAWAGPLYVISEDKTVSADIINLGHWAWAHIEIFKALLEHGQTFVDVGAFIGHHSVAILNAFNGGVKVISIEGQVDYAQILQLNLSIQISQNFRVIHAVASNGIGSMEVPAINLKSQLNFGSLSYVATGDEFGKTRVSVRQTTLDKELFFDDRIGLIKIDVQTFELYVLQGSLEIIKRDFPNLFIEISPRLMKSGPGYDYRQIYSQLVSLGYLLFDVLGNQLPVDLIKNPNHYPEGLEWDIVGIHNSRVKAIRNIPWMS
jgi:FkbM family methyltransferase